MTELEAAEELVDLWRSFARQPADDPLARLLAGAGRAALDRWRNLRGIRVGDRCWITSGPLAGMALANVVELDDEVAVVVLLGDPPTRRRRLRVASLGLSDLEALVAAFDELEAADRAPLDRRALDLAARTGNRGRRRRRR